MGEGDNITGPFRDEVVHPLPRANGFQYKDPPLGPPPVDPEVAAQLTQDETDLEQLATDLSAVPDDDFDSAAHGVANSV